MTGKFDTFTAGDVRDLIAQFPLAWIIAADRGIDGITMLPLLGDYDRDGRLVALVGHMSRRNALVDALYPKGKALVLFMGPQAYISPDDAAEREWGPTWNYAQLRIAVELEFTPDETADAIARLVEKMERERPDPWRIAELGERYDAMLRRIIAFRAKVLDVGGTFKLGQDEPEPVLRNILDRHEDAGIVAWMRRFNRDRGRQS